MGVLLLGLLHDSENFDLDMGDVGLHSLAVTILVGCTCHEHSMKEVEQVHWEVGVPCDQTVVEAMLDHVVLMHQVGRKADDILLM